MSNSGTFKDRYDGLIRIIEKNLMDHIAEKSDFKDISIVKSVASELNENPRSISEIFRFITGVPLGTYIKLRKLDITFTAKKEGRQSTWENAAIIAYENVSSFKYAFKSTYGMPVTEAEKNPDFIQLTKPLYLDSILEGRYTKMDYRTSLNESEWNALKNYELYGSLYDISFAQLSFAKDYIADNSLADIEYVLYVLSTHYSDKADASFTETEAKAFELVIRNGYTRDLAELLVNNLISEGFERVEDIDTSYISIMSQLLYNIKNTSKEDGYTPKYMTYADYLEVRQKLQLQGYNNYWDLYGIATSADESETWNEAIDQYLKDNPEPIEGNWDEDEYLIGTSIIDSAPVADVLSFAEKVYGKERFSKINNPYDELVFAAMFFKGISEADAKTFISESENDDLEKFLSKDYSVRFKYNRLKGRGVL